MDGCARGSGGGGFAADVPAFGDGPITAELGTVRLHLDSDGDKVIFDPTAPGSNQIQTLTAPNCKLTSTGASLVGFAVQQPEPTRIRSPVSRIIELVSARTVRGPASPAPGSAKIWVRS